MFIGEYSASMDVKGRVAIPAKFRPTLNGHVVVTRGLDGSLVLYPEKEWQELALKLASLPISTASSRAFSRLMLAGAMDAEIDAQGRISVPQYLREFARLGKRVIIAGLYNRIELWSENEWVAYKQQTERDSSHIAEQLADLGV